MRKRIIEQLGCLGRRGLLLGGLSVALVGVAAQEIQILSFSQNGLLTWSNATLNVTCRVEWASSLQGPWHSSWESLASVVATNHVTQLSVPMFYRVVCPQTVTNIAPSVALAMLGSRRGDTNFMVLDVRTAGEYAQRHIIGAANLDYYSAGFEAALGSLDRGKVYLVYCASGSRSGRTADRMLALGFLNVYNMLNGIGTFAGLEGAAEFLEP